MQLQRRPKHREKIKTCVQSLFKSRTKFMIRKDYCAGKVTQQLT